MIPISTEYQSVPRAKRVQIGTYPFREVPIGTSPAPDSETDFSGDKKMDTETEKILSAASGQVQKEILRMGLTVERRGKAVWLHGRGINILVLGLGMVRMDDLEVNA